MCGVAGFFGPAPTCGAESAVRRMTEAIRHRGPDGKGHAIFEDAGLGHVRLAIIDLEGGRQPMTPCGSRLTIVYNGEVYNFREIRSRLERAGISFSTRSDTEVVVRAYERWGMEAFVSFRGMFALAIWDQEAREGILVRDRFGIKPMMYASRSQTLLFGSEIKALLPVLPGGAELEPESLHLLMNFRYIPGTGTLFQGVRHLPPGHLLRWKEGRTRLIRWAPAEPTEPVTGEGDVVEEVWRLLDQSVNRQLVSDVPLGGYLSGGIDSATLAALAIRHLPKGQRLPTFTIQTGDSPLEAVHAAETARILGADNVQERGSEDLAQSLPRLLWHLEVPKVNAWQSDLVARLAARHVKVALSGLGGDEIFVGYHLHRLIRGLAGMQRAGLGGPARWIGRQGWRVLAGGGLRWDEARRGCKALAALPDWPAVYGILRNVWDCPDLRQTIYGPRLLDQKLPDGVEFIRGLWPREEGGNPLASILRFEREHKMVNDLLLQEDRLGMAHGLEVRVPFLDEDLVAFVSRVDLSIRMAGGKLKGLMRQVVAPLLPAQVLNRPKSGFQVPIHRFFQTHLRPLCQTHLSRERVKASGLFNYDFVDAVLRARPAPRLRWHYFLLYLMLGVHLWEEIFLGRPDVASPLPSPGGLR